MVDYNKKVQILARGLAEAERQDPDEICTHVEEYEDIETKVDKYPCWKEYEPYANYLLNKTFCDEEGKKYKLVFTRL